MIMVFINHGIDDFYINNVRNNNDSEQQKRRS